MLWIVRNHLLQEINDNKVHAQTLKSKQMFGFWSSIFLSHSPNTPLKYWAPITLSMESRAGTGQSSESQLGGRSSSPASASCEVSTSTRKIPISEWELPCMARGEGGVCSGCSCTPCAPQLPPGHSHLALQGLNLTSNRAGGVRVTQPPSQNMGEQYGTECQGFPWSTCPILPYRFLCSVGRVKWLLLNHRNHFQCFVSMQGGREKNRAGAALQEGAEV